MFGASRAGVTRRSNRRRLFHTGCWWLQLAFWLGLIAACFAMPNSVYSGYSQFAKIAAGLFLVLVVILFVDWWVHGHAVPSHLAPVELILPSNSNCTLC